MRRLALVAVVVLALGAVLAGPANQPASQDADVMKIVPDIEARVRQFVRAPLATDLSPLAAGDREALTHLVEAARVVHEVFQRQAWRGGPASRARLAASTAPRADAAREYYRIMAKPWDELREREPFVGGLKRPPGAGFYPEDMTRDEFEKQLQARPRDRAAFMSPTTIVERRDGRLVAVPFAGVFCLPYGKACRET